VSGKDEDLEKRALEIVKQIESLYNKLLNIISQSKRISHATELAWREHAERYLRNLTLWVKGVFVEVSLDPTKRSSTGEECCRECMEKLYINDDESCTYVCGSPCYGVVLRSEY
jgi:hypothetical protein